MLKADVRRHRNGVKSRRSARAPFLLLSLAASSAFPAAAIAQSATNVAPTREELTRPVPPPPTRLPTLEVEGGFERAPCALDGPDFQSIKFTLRAVEFEGLKQITAEQLAPAYASYVGKELPIATVCEIRDRAAAELRSAGYIAAVQIPEQRIEDGTVRFTVLMAHLARVQVRGDASGAEKVIASYLNRLTAEPVFNRYEAERYLLLASDIPGYTVRLTLRPEGSVPGDVVGDVAVQRLPVYADINLANYGTHELGRWGAFARAQAFGLTGMGDRTTLSFFTTTDIDEQQTIQLAHDFRVGSEGLSLGGSLLFAAAHPSVDDANIRARTVIANVFADYPFVRSLSTSVHGTAGVDFVNQRVSVDGDLFSRDRLRTAFFRLSLDSAKTNFSNAGYSLAEPPWRLSGSVEYRQGMSIINASPDCIPVGNSCRRAGDVPPSRLHGNADAAVFRANAYGEYRPVPKMTLALGLRAQFAPTSLLSFDEFAGGNYTAGRGYDPGAVLGDMGVGSQFEVRYGSRIPASARRAAVEGYMFWDRAAATNYGPLDEGELKSDRLHSVGLGFRTALDRFSLDLGFAVPLSRVGIDNDKPNPRFLVSLTSRLWPWTYK